MSDNDPYSSPQYGQNDPYGNHEPYGTNDPYATPDKSGQSGQPQYGQYGQQSYDQQAYGGAYGQPQYNQQQPYGYAQPGPYGYAQTPAGPPPDNNLVWAILSTVLCCLPLGIVSIVFSTQVNSKWALGDVQGAHEAANKAKKWAIASAVVSLVLVVLYIVGIAVFAANSSNSNY